MDDDLAGSIAAQVRRVRLNRGFSPAELADRAGIARSTMSQLERGQGNPTLSTLQNLATALSVDVRTLLGLDRSDDGLLVVRAGTGQDVSGGAISGRLMRTMTVPAGSVEVHSLTLSAGGHESSASHGTGAREHVLVSSGTLVVGTEREHAELSAGDYAGYPADHVHEFTNPGATPATFWIVCTYPAVSSDR